MSRRRFSNPRNGFDWAFLFYWLIGTTFGWMIADLFPGLSILAAGLTVGFFQAVILYQRIDKAWRWALASTIGWIAGGLLSFLIVPAGLEIIEGILIGLAVGLAQWTVVHSSHTWAAWWPMISLIGWTTGISLLPGQLMTGTMAGLITGVALEFVLRYPKKTPSYD